MDEICGDLSEMNKGEKIEMSRTIPTKYICGNVGELD